MKEEEKHTIAEKQTAQETPQPETPASEEGEAPFTEEGKAPATEIAPDSDEKQEADAPWKAVAREDEEPLSAQFTLRKILGGDILNAQFIRRQIWLILIIVAFTIVYVTNRYSCQKHLIEIDQLNKQLQKSKYKALSSSSELTEKSRESRILDLLKQNHDSLLHIANQPPYIIQVPDGFKEEN